MRPRQRKLLLASFLLVFLASTVLAGFLHTERTCKPDPNCPACQFQSSSLSVSTIHFFIVPEPAFIACIEPALSPSIVDSAGVSRASRAPPQA